MGAWGVITINIWLFNILIWFTLISLCIMVYSFTKRKTNGSIIFGLLVASTTFYSAGYAFELISTSLDSLLLFNSIQYIGIPFIGALLLMFSIQVTSNRYKLKPSVVILLLIIPIITCVMRGTIDIHNYFYINPQIVNMGGFYVLKNDKGIWYFVSTMFTLFCAIISFALFVRCAKRNKGNRRIQSTIMLIAVLPSTVLAAITNLGSTPQGIDITPIGLAISTIILLIGLYKYHLLNPVTFVRQKAFQWSDTAMLVLNESLELLDFNTKAKEIFGTPKMQIIGKNIKDSIDKEKNIADLIQSNKPYTKEIKRYNDIFKYQIKASPLYDKEPNIIGYLVLLNDITAHENTIKELHDIVSKDSLTGVLSRRTFDEKVEHEIKRAQRKKSQMSIMIFDVDKFKYINDNFGHPTGDKLLIKIAELCINNMREIDFIGRMGGDEFVILFSETSKEDALFIAKRIKKIIDEIKLSVDNIDIGVTVSIGIAITKKTNSEFTLKELYKYADIALYKAKNAGRNCIKYEYI